MPNSRALSPLVALTVVLALTACGDGLSPLPFQGISGTATLEGALPDSTEWVRIAVYEEIPAELLDFTRLIAFSETLDLSGQAAGHVVALDPGAYPLVLAFWKQLGAPVTALKIAGWHTQGAPPFGAPAVADVAADVETIGIDLTVAFDSLLSFEEALQRLP